MSNAHAPEAHNTVYVGISGWTYPPWRGIFYPESLKQAQELRFASRAFSSIELNGSFYSLQRPQSYAHWYAETPPGFVFAVKGGRYITHMKRLRDTTRGLANFFASGVLELREKLGPSLAASANAALRSGNAADLSGSAPQDDDRRGDARATARPRRSVTQYPRASSPGPAPTHAGSTSCELRRPALRGSLAGVRSC